MVPDDFTAFVASHGGRVGRACVEIAGNDQVADGLRDDVLAAVAARWSQWPATARADRALVRIQRLLQREARRQQVTVDRAALDLGSPGRVGPGPFGAAQDEPLEVDRDETAERLAGTAWRRAGRARRARWIGVGVTGLVVLAAALLMPPEPSPSPPLPSEVPGGVTVLPGIDDLMQQEWRGSDLPPYLALSPSDVDGMPALDEAPLARATLVAQANDSRLVVAGDETIAFERFRVSPLQRRRVEHPALRGADLIATSLSPDGATVALPKAGDLVLVDIRTGRVRTIPVGAAQPAGPDLPVLTWLDSNRIMLPGSGAQVVNLTTKDVVQVIVDPFNALNLRGYGSPRLAHLVPVPPNPNSDEGPHTIRSLLMFWRDMDPAGNLEPVAGAGQVGIRRIVTGSTWLSDWVGPGFAAPQLVVRACDPSTLLLPADVGPASAAVAAIDGNGNEIATLVATAGTRLDALGMISEVEALVAARVDGRSLLVAWNPHEGTLVAVSHINADTQASVADLLALSIRPN